MYKLSTSTVWCPQYLTYIDRIETVQKGFLKFLSYKYTFQLIPGNTENFISLTFFDMISLEYRRKVNDLLLRQTLTLRAS